MNDRTLLGLIRAHGGACWQAAYNQDRDLEDMTKWEREAKRLMAMIRAELAARKGAKP